MFPAYLILVQGHVMRDASLPIVKASRHHIWCKRVSSSQKPLITRADPVDLTGVESPITGTHKGTLVITGLHKAE